MPTYFFRNKKTGEEFERFMGISESEQFLKDNPDIEKAPILFNFGGYSDPKAKTEFRQVLNNMSNSMVIDRKSKDRLKSF